VQVNGPPEGGSCIATPPKGRALTTRFTLQCSSWTDVEAAFPLTYAFAARRAGSGQLVLSASMNQSAVLQVSREPTLSFRLPGIRGAAYGAFLRACLRHSCRATPT
jgi:hypothetical protein